MNSKRSLFLRQSYIDAWTGHCRSMGSSGYVRWDYVILTASNEEQAETYRTQINARLSRDMIPKQTHYAVLPDPDGKRVGSGGATFNALRYVSGHSPDKDPFAGKRILVIHSGGDSKRAPQYSVCGKLFSPVPRELPSGKRSTLFDEFMIGMSGVAGRIKEGMLVLSGDVLLLFNHLQIDYTGSGAAAISFKEDVETGREHGVFCIDDAGNVGYFLHKLSETELRERGAVNDHGMVDIDTGAVLLSCDIMRSLYGLISTGGKADDAKFGTFVNDRARLSFYGDFMYPMASMSSREQYYNEKPEGELCDELLACRTVLWDTLNPFRMKLLRLSPAAFIHFGTSRELLRLLTERIMDYAFLDWSGIVSSNAEDTRYAVNNAVIGESAIIAEGCYIEDSFIAGNVNIGRGSILSFVTVTSGSIPENVVLHGLKLLDGRFVVRVYGVDDNPKGTLEENTCFLHTTLGDFLQINGVSVSELWQSSDHSLWLADLYPVCDSIEEAVLAALNLCDMACGNGSVEIWRSAQRMSLFTGYQQADIHALLDWELKIRKTVKVEKLIRLIERGGTSRQAQGIFEGATLNDYQKKLLEERAEASRFSLKIRIFYYLGMILNGDEGERYISKCFDAIQQGILQEEAGVIHQNAGMRFLKEEITVELPLRVNWGGGWSDTPPYCNECGSTVLNAAISLNGQLPVEVKARRLDEKKVVFESADVGVYSEFQCIRELQNCQNPYDAFALHKAALIACGIIPARNGALSESLDQLGGGIYLSTQVRNVPKGSGLGTSSILAGACVKALFSLFGKQYTDGDIYERVLCLEQIMSTGGGWQDQVGGLTAGIKFTTSRPGMRQTLKVEKVQMPEQAFEELNRRFALIYTGQRRLARNLLRDVVGRYISANPDVLEVFESIQQTAALMRFELERGNIDGFAALLDRHWALSKKLDEGSSNTCIDQIFLVIDDLISGKMICGAGGGGFLQVVLNKGVTSDMLRERLYDVFGDSGVSVWECSLVTG